MVKFQSELLILLFSILSMYFVWIDVRPKIPKKRVSIDSAKNR